MNWIELIREVGPYFGIMFFFVWRDYRREERLEKQIKSQQEFIQGKLVSLLERTNEVLSHVKW
jgi:hypothetical protein